MDLNELHAEIALTEYTLRTCDNDQRVYSHQRAEAIELGNIQLTRLRELEFLRYLLTPCSQYQVPDTL